MEQQAFDYVIVGAGAAGCLLAHRLCEDGRYTVCVLEAGPADLNPYIHIPAGFIKVGHDPRYTWDFSTEPSAGSAGRRVVTRMGRTLGGSSSINGFNYTRGMAEDYDQWAALGNRGWSYREVLPYFKRTERRIGDHDPAVLACCPLRIATGVIPCAMPLSRLHANTACPVISITTGVSRLGRDTTSAGLTSAGASAQRQPFSSLPRRRAA